MASVVEIEDDPLALAQHPEHRALESAGSEIVLRPVGVADYHAFTGARVIRFNHSLHVLLRHLSRKALPLRL